MMNQPLLLKIKFPLILWSWIAFGISLFFYWFTADTDVSYWDCPEYVTVASRLEIGHPPGNPIWMLAMRVATIPFPPHLHAYVINLCSGLFMAFAVLFLCRLIFMPARLWLLRTPWRQKFSFNTCNHMAGIIALGGALSFAFCDSAWFSAVEAEVYAMSTFLSALSLWIMMIWWWEKTKAQRARWLILLAYIMGISLGVHQLNLLLIPVFSLIIYYRFKQGKSNSFIVLGITFLSILLIGFILMVFIPGLLYGAGAFELFGVNSLGFPYHSGVIAFSLLVFSILVILLSLPERWRGLGQFKISVWMITFLLLGFSSYGIILIRAQAYPQMNEGVPDNIFSLSSYINRDQYPSSPLIYGHTPYSRPLVEETFVDGKPVYSRYVLEKKKPVYHPFREGAMLLHRSKMLSHKDSLENSKVISNKHGYVLSDYSFSQKMTPELNMWFPRMTSQKTNDIEAYKGWAAMEKEKMLNIPVSETIDSLGNFRPRLNSAGHRPEVFSYRPTYLQNLRFFMAYQAYYMYFRYLFWNFIGRQNDFPSMGEIEHGNFITGIPAIDSRWFGVTSEIPPELARDNKGRNRYFGIPFILGIIGIIFLSVYSRKSRRFLTVTSVLFLMTGLAIVVYLNQNPGEPRERDYTFLMSYFTFAIWIAAGVVTLVNCIKFLPSRIIFIITAIISLGIPALMAAENFDDHDRRGRYETSFFVSSLTDFPLSSIIFSYGDNSSFPLWYATEVTGEISGKHTPVDITYLSLPSYVSNLKKQGLKGISTFATSPMIDYGAYVLTKIPEDSVSRPMPLNKVLEDLYSKDYNGYIPALSSSLVIVPRSESDSVIINLHDFTGGKPLLPFKQLMLLDIMAAETNKANPRVLFFPYSLDPNFYKALQPVLRPVLFGNVYAPTLSDEEIKNIMLSSINRELKKLGNLPQNSHYIDPLIADRIARYRGEMIVAAMGLLQQGENDIPKKMAEKIIEVYPYDRILPGSFTLGDSTFYEGKEFSKLLKDLYLLDKDEKWRVSSQQLDTLLQNRYDQWWRYYRSLPAYQRSTLSNKSRHLLVK